MSEAQTHQTHAELMKEIGSEEGYDPMPPSQHRAFLDIRESMTSRAIAWVWQKTIRPGRGRRRSPYARDERGDLTLKHAAADLGWALSNASAVFKQLEEQGRIRRDEKRRIWLTGNVPAPQMAEGSALDPTGRTKCEVTNTYKVPDGLVAYFHGLGADNAEKYSRDYQLLKAYQEQINADAMAAARAAGQEVEQRFYAAIGYKQGLRKGEPPKGRPPLTAERAVQLSLLTLPPLSVQIAEPQFVQNSAAYSVQEENGFVRKTSSLLNSENQSVRVSEATAQPQNAHVDPATPPPAPLTFTGKTTSKKVEEEEASPVVETVENLFNRRLGGARDPLRKDFETLAGKFGIPARSVCRFLQEKWMEKGESRYPIRTPGALYQFAEEDLPGWIQQHQREILADEREEGRSAPASAAEETFDPLEFRRQLNELTQGAAAGKKT